MTELYAFPDWLENIRRTIRAFSDIEYQRRVWMNGLGPEVDSYVEAMCRLFDDHIFELFLSTASEEKLLSERQIFALKAFRDALQSFDDRVPDVPNQAILDHPGWTDVRGKAATALAALDLDDAT